MSATRWRKNLVSRDCKNCQHYSTVNERCENVNSPFHGKSVRPRFQCSVHSFENGR